ncbi:MAG: hypothetical protein PHU46_17585 [Rhodocyclaceae bacterium]|nr:hypothetical protein [Rhodocyclaceae bacterium]
MEKIVLIAALLGSFWMAIQGTRACVSALWLVVRRFSTADKGSKPGIANTTSEPKVPTVAPDKTSDPWAGLNTPTFMRKGGTFAQIEEKAEEKAARIRVEREAVSKPKRRIRRTKAALDPAPSLPPDFDLL